MSGTISANTAAISRVLLCLCSLIIVDGAQAQPSQNATDMRLLYEGADYDGALALAARLDVNTLPPQEAREIYLYGALCELAVGNQSEAEKKLESILQADPLYTPPDEMPNRLRLLTDQVRRKVAPAVAQAQYHTGKKLFDAQDCAGAVTPFEMVLQLIPPGDETTSPPLADVRTLASGFLTLCQQTLAANKAAAPSPAVIPIPASASDPTVVPPVAIYRDVPAWPRPLMALRPVGEGTLTGIIQVVINKNGRVDHARISEPIHPLYDGTLMTATKTWRFEPATKNGEPVDYLLNLKIEVRQE